MSKRLFLILTLLLCFITALVACGDPTDLANDPNHVHTEEVIAAKPATCMETGLTEGKKCSVCNTVTVAQKIAPVADHHFGWLVDVPSTVTVHGVRHEECSFCGLKRNEGASIPLLTHEHSYEKGLCTVCGEAGGYITLGSYEQDNDLENGKEAIEWLVLDVKDGKALVVSKYILDFQLFHAKAEDFTWGICSSRTWLNDTFYNTAFSADDKAKILTSTVDNPANPLYNATDSSPTNDKLFLLSMQEVEEYFDSSTERAATPTAYAMDRGVGADEKTGNAWWWLRNNGVYARYAALVARSGLVMGYGTSHNASAHFTQSDCGIRPAMWITLD